MKYDCIYICWSVFIDNYMYKLKAEKPLFWKLYVAKETGVQVAVLLSSYLYKKQHSKLQFNLETVDKKSLFFGKSTDKFPSLLSLFYYLCVMHNACEHNIKCVYF